MLPKPIIKKILCENPHFRMRAICKWVRDFIDEIYKFSAFDADVIFEKGTICIINRLLAQHRLNIKHYLNYICCNTIPVIDHLMLIKDGKYIDELAYIAYESGNLKIFEHLAENNRVCIRRCLNFAWLYKRTADFKYLLNFTINDADYYNAVSYACHFGKLGLIKYLINSGADYTEFDVVTAIRERKFNVVKYFLKAGFKVNDYIAKTAVPSKYPLLIKWIIKSGYTNLKYLMRCAIELQNLTLVKIIYNSGQRWNRNFAQELAAPKKIIRYFSEK